MAQANALIGAEDVLGVEVFDTPELSTASARVSETGDVNLPVLGQVEVAGLNPNQAARKIESKLRSRGIMLTPHVTVSIVEGALRGATLLGEVKSPGVYAVTGAAPVGLDRAGRRTCAECGKACNDCPPG